MFPTWSRPTLIIPSHVISIFFRSIILDASTAWGVALAVLWPFRKYVRCPSPEPRISKGEGEYPEGEARLPLSWWPI